jgi:hypothetical protein
MWKDISLMLSQHLDEILLLLSQYGMIKAPLPVLYGIQDWLIQKNLHYTMNLQVPCMVKIYERKVYFGIFIDLLEKMPVLKIVQPMNIKCKQPAESVLILRIIM